MNKKKVYIFMMLAIFVVIFLSLKPQNPYLEKLKTSFYPNTSEMKEMYEKVNKILLGKKIHIEKQIVWTHNYIHEKITLYYLQKNKLSSNERTRIINVVCSAQYGINKTDTLEIVRVLDDKISSSNLSGAVAKIDTENTCEYWSQFPVNVMTTPYVTPWK